MSFQYQPVTFCVWALLCVLQLYLAGVLCFGQNHGPRRYSAFRAVVYYAAVKSPVLYAISVFGPYAAYWWSYWTTELISACLLGCLLYELWYELFRPAWAIPRSVIRTFLTAVGAVAASAVIIGVSIPSTYPDLLMALTLTSARTVALITTAATILIAFFGGYYGAHWRSRVYGLALGLMFQGVVNSALTIAGAAVNGPPPDLFRALTPFSACICVSVWIYYFSRAEKRALAIYDADVSKILGKRTTAEALHD
jgi:hypothetical protein